MRSTCAYLALSAALVALGCGDNTGTWGNTDGGVTRAGIWISGEGGNLTLDILFVVDDTSAPTGQPMAASIAGIFRALDSFPSPGVSLHVAFVSGAALPNGSGCTPPQTRGALCGLDAPDDYARISPCAPANFSGDRASTLGCLGDLASAGCGKGQPLAAAVRALGAAEPAGDRPFLRDHAHLAIIVLAAADDASGAPGALTPVADLIKAVQSFKAEGQDQILVSVMAPTSACPGTTASLAGAPRLKEFAAAFAHAVFVSPCEDPATLAIPLTGPSIDRGLICLHDLRDVDSERPGLQPDCVVSERIHDYETGETTQALVAPCDRAGAPCWRLKPQPSCWMRPDSLQLVIDRTSDFCPASSSSDATITCTLN